MTDVRIDASYPAADSTALTVPTVQQLRIARAVTAGAFAAGLIVVVTLSVANTPIPWLWVLLFPAVPLVFAGRR